VNCERIQDRLFEYADDALDDGARGEVERHLEGCAECAEFAQALRRPADQPEDWTRALLQRTSSDPCAQAFDRLPPWIDGDLERLDAELVGGHIEHCVECDALAAVLRAMRADLPELAEVEPDAAFVDDVLAATVAVAAPLPWVARLDDWFAKLMQRPRIAWEGAYLATAFLLLLVFFPGSPLADVPSLALDITRESPTRIEQPFIALRTNLNVGAQEAWFSTATAARSIAVRASVESGDAYRYARRGVGTLWDRFASDPLTDETRETSPNGESK
jgi:anti-sigma factor RsiW